jgi:hypothetical protein
MTASAILPDGCGVAVLTLLAAAAPAADVLAKMIGTAADSKADTNSIAVAHGDAGLLALGAHR